MASWPRLKPVFALFGFLCLAGCVADAAPPAPTISAPTPVQPSSVSVKDAKKMVLASKARSFKDPDSIKDARIGQPFTCLTGSGDCVCVEANGKNSMGGYTGLQVLGFKLSGKSAEAFGEMSRTDACGEFVPFPELNGKRGR